MFERIHFLVMYVGSAAVVAFIAACLTSSQAGTSTCDTSDTSDMQRCELLAKLAASVAPEAGVSSDGSLAPELEAAVVASPP